MPRIEQNVPGLYYGPGTYPSPLPSDTLLTEAWQFGPDSVIEGSQTWATSSMSDATLLARSTMSRMGAQIGVPSAFALDFEAIVQSVIDPSAEQIINVTTELAFNLMDDAFRAMGGVPFVGFVASVISAGIKLAIRRSLRGEPAPPIVAEYDKGVNEDFATWVMNIVGAPAASTPDWTPIFRPPRQGAWTTRAAFELREPSTIQDFVIQREWFPAALGDPLSWDGFGIVPGRAHALLPIYSSGLTWEQILFLAEGEHFPAGSQSPLPRLTWPERYRLVGDRTWNRADVLPSFVHAGMAAWQAMSTKTAAIFNVDTTGLGSLWTKYVGSALAEMQRWMDTHSREGIDGEYWAGWAAKRGLYDLPSYEEKIEAAAQTGGKIALSSWYDFPEQSRYDNIAKARFDELRTRQEKALDTLLVAYCSINQPAFREPTAEQKARDPRARKSLRSLLLTRRQQLLRHPARYEVNLDDVIDPDYRADLYYSRMQVEGGKLTAAPPGAVEAKPPDRFPGVDEVPPGEPWGPAGDRFPTETRSSWPYIAGGIALTGATAATYFYWDQIAAFFGKARRRLPGG